MSDVSPSVCREVASHVSRRTAAGAMLLVALFEASGPLKAKALEGAGRKEVTSFKQ